MLPVELILPGRQHELPTLPRCEPASPRLRMALRECGRTAARESGRLALSRVQLQGTAGRVVGTDGKVALLWAGFRFPFPDDALVPTVPVFGAGPLARAVDVRVGRTAAHLAVAVGPWVVWLPTDAKAKFPGVAAVVPRPAQNVHAEPDVLRPLPRHGEQVSRGPDDRSHPTSNDSAITATDAESMRIRTGSTRHGFDVRPSDRGRYHS